MNNTLTLYELNNLVRQALELTMYDQFWVCAEISDLRDSRHCYMELVQKDESGNSLKAKARAQIWANKWAVIKPKFERATRQALSNGMQVLVKVEITFHELYGFSLNIVDIDPTYTLGDIAKRKEEILRQLKEEGVDNMNKELPLPRNLQRIAVISSASAAGYGDFCNQLNSNKRCLAFKTKLFSATMQGEDVERTIIDALNRIAAELDDWDAVVIIRGGGATSDLSGFDKLLLAEYVAQFPLPVITGIGHERDDTVIDLISHTRVKTPTAAAEFLIHHQEEELDMVEDFSARLTNVACAMLDSESARLKLMTSKLPLLFATSKANANLRISRISADMARASIQMIERARNATTILEGTLKMTSLIAVDKEKQRIELAHNKIESASPERILRLGFSIARINGKAIQSIDEVKEGDEIETTLANGIIKSKVL